MYRTVLYHVAEHRRLSLCQQYHVSTNIVSFLSTHVSNSIVSCGSTMRTFIVSTISCIDQHCAIYQPMYRTVLYQTVLYQTVLYHVAQQWRPSLCQQYHVSYSIVSCGRALETFIVSTISCIDQHCVIYQPMYRTVLYQTVLYHVAQQWRPSLCQQYHVSTNIVSSINLCIVQYCVMWQSIGDLHCVNNIMYRPTLCHLSTYVSYSIVSCGRASETFIVSTISCIDQHCVISINPCIEQYCIMWLNNEDLHCVNNIMYRPTLCHLSTYVSYSIVSCGRASETFIVSTISCIDQHCVISINPCIEQYCIMWLNNEDLHCVNNIMYRPTLCHLSTHVSNSIVSNSIVSNSIVSCGSTMETVIVSTISCIDQHCVIYQPMYRTVLCHVAEHWRPSLCQQYHVSTNIVSSINPCIEQYYIKQYCIMWLNNGDRHCVNNIMYRPTLCHLSTYVSYSIVSCGRALETFIVSTISCIDQHCVIYQPMYRTVLYHVAEHRRLSLCQL